MGETLTLLQITSNTSESNLQALWPSSATCRDLAKGHLHTGGVYMYMRCVLQRCA